MPDNKFKLQPEKLKAVFKVDFKPSKISQLENDSGFVNKEDVDNLIKDIVPSPTIKDHSELINRDAKDQHPIEAITDLGDQLQNIQANLDLLKILDPILKDDVETQIMSGALEIKKQLDISDDDGHSMQFGFEADASYIATNNTLDILSPTNFTTSPNVSEDKSFDLAPLTSLMRKQQIIQYVSSVKEELKQDLSSVYKYKGSVTDYSSLPINSEVGDVYNVEDTGNNYAWTGSEWDGLGGSIDLSDYATTSDVDDKLTNYLPLSGGTLTGSLKFGTNGNISTSSNQLWLGTGNSTTVKITSTSLFPSNTSYNLGSSFGKWNNIYVTKLNNGATINVPTKGGTLALTSDIESYISDHNTDETAHEDIRNEINNISGDIASLEADVAIIKNSPTYTNVSDIYGIEADYALRYGITDCPNGLITYSVNTKEVEIQPGIVIQAAGSDVRTTIASATKYEIEETGKVTLFFTKTTSSSGTTQVGFLEAGDVYYQENEPSNGTTSFLAWWQPSKKMWQFKSNYTGNVWREAVATPIANINAGEIGITSINYVGYRIIDDDTFAQLSDIENIQTYISQILSRLDSVEESIGNISAILDSINGEII